MALYKKRKPGEGNSFKYCQSNSDASACKPAKEKLGHYRIYPENVCAAGFSLRVKSFTNMAAFADEAKSLGRMLVETAIRDYLGMAPVECVNFSHVAMRPHPAIGNENYLLTYARRVIGYVFYEYSKTEAQLMSVDFMPGDFFNLRK